MRLARLAMRLGFYARGSSIDQICYRFEKTIADLNLGGEGNGK